MAQQLKEKVRESILAAAEREFADRGYAATTVAAIARRAGISTGNVYRYYSSKTELFEALITPELVASYRARIRRRVVALRGVRDIRSLGEDAPFFLVAADLFDFTVENRLRVVILLGRCEGTRYEGFASQTVEDLVRLALEHRKSIISSGQIPSSLRYTLERIYESYVANLVSILAHFEDADELRSVVDQYSAYHLSGLQRLFERSEGEPG